jgi:alkanesulfonate monooxygenase
MRPAIAAPPSNVSLLRRTWTEPAPFDHEGEFYRTRATYSEIRCRQQPHIPIYGGGGSDAAIHSLAPHVDVFMLWGEPLKDTALFMDRVRREAALCGRNPTFSLSTRPILAATEGEAWDRARATLDRVLINRGGTPAPKRQNVGSNRLLQAAAEAEVHDTCLWTSLAAATGASGNSTALVGTPETVAQALLEYHKLGATSLLIRGYDPRPDAVQYGEELIPRIRELVANYDAARRTRPRKGPYVPAGLIQVRSTRQSAPRRLPDWHSRKPAFTKGCAARSRSAYRLPHRVTRQQFSQNEPDHCPTRSV